MVPAEGGPIPYAAAPVVRLEDRALPNPTDPIAYARSNRVLVLRHHGIHLAMNDAYWAKFNVGESTGFKDAGGRGLKINPTRAARAEVPEPFRNMTLEAFQRSGGLVHFHDDWIDRRR